MPQYPLALGDLIIHDGGDYYAKILGGRGLPEVTANMAARYNAWPVTQGVNRSARQLYIEHYLERLSDTARALAKIALYQKADYELTNTERLMVCDNPIPGAGYATTLLWFGPWDFYNDGTDDGGDWFARDLLNPDTVEATITGMVETVAGRFDTHPAFPVGSGTEVNLDASASLLNAKTYLEIRALIKVPYAYNSGSWGSGTNYVFYIYGDANNYIYLRYNESTTKWTAAIKSGGTAITLTSASQTFAADAWLDLVVTLDFTTDSYKLYVNGTLEDTDTTALAVIASYAQMNIGGTYTGTGYGYTVDTFMVADYACGLPSLYGLDINPRYVDVLGLGVQPLTVDGAVSDTALVSTHVVDGDVRWRRPGSVELWNITSSPGSLTVTNNGQDDAYPVINITPRVAKSGGFQYQRWVPIKWNITSGYTNYPVTTGALNLTGKAQADGDDIRVYVDGVEVDRWLSGTLVSAVSVWFNLTFQANIALTLDGDITDSVTSLTVNEDVSSMPATGILYIGTEAITYTAKSNATKTFSGCTRGAKFTTAAAHSDSDDVYWIQHDVFIYYGDASLTAPTTDDDYKPIFTLASSSNTSWVFAEFGSGAGTRPGTWTNGSSVVFDNTGTSYSTFYTANRGTNANPWEEMGYNIFCDASSSTYAVRKSWLRFYNPCKITNIAITNGEYKCDAALAGTEIKIQDGDSPGSGGSLSNGIDTISVTLDNAWHSWSSSGACSAGGSSYVQAWNQLSSNGGASPYSATLYYEFADCTLTLSATYTPTVAVGAEQTNSYTLAATIANTTTGESLTINTTLELDETITIDCNNSTIEHNDGTSLLGAKTLDSVRRYWLRLQPGSNTLTYTDTGTTDVDLAIYWDRRYYE